jgi:alpha-L-rhamnosidase
MAAAAVPLGASAAEVKATAGMVGNVRDFKAVGDGKAKDTAAIQQAIDAASTAGGGMVFVPNGNYLCGTIQLRDNVTLHLAEGATILGSTEGSDYVNFAAGGFNRAPLALVLALKARKIAITGRGTINGQGGGFPHKDNAPGRPFGIKLVDCEDVLIADVRVQDAAAWVIHLLRCERAVVRASGAMPITTTTASILTPARTWPFPSATSIARTTRSGSKARRTGSARTL